MVGFTADPVIYASLNDAQNILFEPDPDLLRNIRRRDEAQVLSASAEAPQLQLQQSLAPRVAQIAENVQFANAVAVKASPGVSVEEVANEICLAKMTTDFEINSLRRGPVTLLKGRRSILPEFWRETTVLGRP